MGNYDLGDIKPLMTDIEGDDQPSELPAAVRRRPWIVRFASIFGLWSQGQGPSGIGGNGGMGGGVG